MSLLAGYLVKISKNQVKELFAMFIGRWSLPFVLIVTVSVIRPVFS